MEKQDNLYLYMKELPGDSPSSDFTRSVMDRIAKENVATPVVYKPLISKAMWIFLICSSVVVFLISTFLRTIFPGQAAPSRLNPFYQIDFSFMVKPLQSLMSLFSHFSFPLLSGLVVMTLFLFLFADHLYLRISRR